MSANRWKVDAASNRRITCEQNCTPEPNMESTPLYHKWRKHERRNRGRYVCAAPPALHVLILLEKRGQCATITQKAQIMKSAILHTAIVLGAAFTLGACSQGNGALSQSAVRATLAAKTLMVTPCTPEWLQDGTQQHRLSDTERALLRRMLKNAEVREIPDSMYRSAEKGNRADSTDKLFYIYGSNGQCLGARVIDKRVMLDDLQLDKETQEDIYKLLRPHLKRLFQNSL